MYFLQVNFWVLKQRVLKPNWKIRKNKKKLWKLITPRKKDDVNLNESSSQSSLAACSGIINKRKKNKYTPFVSLWWKNKNHHLPFREDNSIHLNDYSNLPYPQLSTLIVPKHEAFLSFASRGVTISSVAPLNLPHPHIIWCSISSGDN